MGIKNSVKNKVRPQNKHLKPFKPGESGNPNGRPVGQRNYKTIYRLALEKIAKENGVSAEEFEVMLEAKGIAFAYKGEYQYFKDVRDRVHGQAVKAVDITSGGKTMGELLDELEQS